MILSVVVWFQFRNSSINGPFGSDHLVDLANGNLVELIWTVSPALVLWAIGLPSLDISWHSSRFCPSTHSFVISLWRLLQY